MRFQNSRFRGSKLGRRLANRLPNFASPAKHVDEATCHRVVEPREPINARASFCGGGGEGRGHPGRLSTLKY